MLSHASSKPHKFVLMNVIVPFGMARQYGGWYVIHGVTQQTAPTQRMTTKGSIGMLAHLAAVVCKKLCSQAA